MSACTKRAFRSEGAARAASSKIGDEIATYRCPECGQIHITHRSSKERRNKRDRWKPSDRRQRHWKG